MPDHLLAIDPGLDVAGVAVFRLPETSPARPVDALRLLAGTERLVTSASAPLVERLAMLADDITEVVQQWHSVAAHVEEPPTWHAARQRGRIPPANVLRSVAKLDRAIGALVAALGQTLTPVEMVAASGTPKDTRHMLLHEWAEEAGITLPTGPQGGKRPDVWDAIWIGVQGLVEGVATTTGAPS